MTETSRVVRPAADRPSWRTVLWRTVVVTVVTAVGLWLLAAILPGFSIDSSWDALLAGFVVGVANAVIWPALAFLVVPLSVLTLGLGAIVLNACSSSCCWTCCPGSRSTASGRRCGVVVGLVVVTTAVSALLAIDDDAWFDQRAARQARRRSQGAVVTDVPGVVFIQLDGVAHAVLRRALRSGDVPDPAPVDPRRQPPARRVGDRVVVADRCQPVRDPARLDRRHAGVPLDRQVDRRGDRCRTTRSPRRRSSRPTPTATACSPTTVRATATCSPATPSGPCSR